MAADLLEYRCRAQGAEQACGHHLVPVDLDPVQRLAQVLAIATEDPVVTMPVLLAAAELLERPAFDSMPLVVTHAIGHHHEIARVLVEEFVGLRVKRVGRRIPYDLIDPDGIAAVVVAEANE